VKRTYLIAAAIAAILALPILAILMRLPPWMTAIALFGLMLVFALRGRLWPGPGEPLAVQGEEPGAAMAGVLAAAHQDLARMVEAPARKLGPSVETIAAAAKAAIARIESGAPMTDIDRRLLAYYLPKAADFAQAWAVLLARDDAARMQAVGRAMADIADHLAGAANDQWRDDLSALDVELRLLEEALKQDRPTASG
jgi:hypothetical protein